MKAQFIIYAVFAFTLAFTVSCVSLPEEEYRTAATVRETVHAYELRQYAVVPYDTAEERFLVADGMYSNAQSGERLRNKEKKAMKEDLLVAISNYTLVLSRGLAQATDASRSDMSEAKGSADEIKAKVSAKEEYAEAEALYAAALRELEAAKTVSDDAKRDAYYKKAMELFAKSEEMYKKAYEIAKKKKEAAEKALKGVE